MAKNRKNVSVFDLPQAEIQQAAKLVQDEAIFTIPVQKQEVIVAPEPTHEPLKNDKLKIIYVDTNHHAQAKATAAFRGMKLGEYVEYLIEQDRIKGLRN